jgi:hypothetical protein
MKWLFNYLVNHVLELFRNLKNKKLKHEESFWITTATSNKKLKNLCTWDEQIKKINPKQKNKLCTILKYLPSQPIYLPS